MIIKRYIQFISESTIEDFNSLGEWVESLMNDEYIRNIVIRYTDEFDPHLRISNVINLLDSHTQNEIKGQVQRYLETGIEEKEPYVLVSTETEELLESIQEITVSGKSVFNSFLKSLTALGKKESKPNFENCPDDFLLFYSHINLLYTDVKQIFSRFKSLSRYIDIMDYQKNELGIYYGLKCDGSFEYGFLYDSPIAIGRFKITPKIVKWLLQIESKSSESLKRELINLSHSDIILLGQIKKDMSTFNPGYFEKKAQPVVMNKVISFGYYGFGKWDNGKLDEGELENLKSNFSTFALSKKWGDKILMSIKPESFWLKIHIKLK
jgi:hypothetical protein